MFRGRSDISHGIITRCSCLSLSLPRSPRLVTNFPSAGTTNERSASHLLYLLLSFLRTPKGLTALRTDAMNVLLKDGFTTTEATRIL